MSETLKTSSPVLEVRFNQTTPPVEDKPKPLTFVEAKNILTAPGAKVLVEVPEPKVDQLKEFAAQLHARFDDTDPNDPKKPGPLKKAFLEKRIFIRLEDEPRRRVRIGVNQGIHTYVIVSEEQGKLATQTYSMIPADFNNLVISQIRECGVEISKNRFTRPSGI